MNFNAPVFQAHMVITTIPMPRTIIDVPLSLEVSSTGILCDKPHGPCVSSPQVHHHHYPNI